MTHDIFISYRRDGGEHLAGRIKDALRSRGFLAFMDVEDLKPGKFDEALLQKIEEATDVLVVLTPGCLNRCNNDGDWLRQEIRHAIKCHKNIVPIIARGFDIASAADCPKDISELFRYGGLTPAHEMFEASIDRLETKFLKSVRKPNQNTHSALLSLPPEISAGETNAHLHHETNIREQQTRQPAPSTVATPGSVDIVRDEAPHKLQATPHNTPVYDPHIKSPERYSLLEIDSDPPGAAVIIDGGAWEVTTPETIKRVIWGSHHYYATLEDERRSADFEVKGYMCPVSIDFPKVKQRRAEAKADEEFWSKTTATDTEESYARYLTESCVHAHATAAEHRLNQLREERASKEEEERRELIAWTAAAKTDTEDSYTAYLIDSRLRTHQGEAETRLDHLRKERAQKEERVRKQQEIKAAEERERVKAEEREAKLWTGATTTDTEEGYASYLKTSALCRHRRKAESRLEELRVERVRREEEERQQRERAEAARLARLKEREAERRLWSTATKTDTEEGYASYVAESRLHTHRNEAEARFEELRVARVRKAEEEQKKRNEDTLWTETAKTDTESAYRAYLTHTELRLHATTAEERLHSLLVEKNQREEVLWAKTVTTNTEESYGSYLTSTAMRLHADEAERRMRQLLAARMQREEEEMLWAKTLKANTEDAFLTYLGISKTRGYAGIAEQRRQVLLAARMQREEDALWAKTVKTDTEEAYDTYLATSRMRLHRKDAKDRAHYLLASKKRCEEEAKRAEIVKADAQRRSLLAAKTQREEVLWAKALKTASEHGYARYLADSELRLHAKEAQERMQSAVAARTQQEDALRAKTAKTSSAKAYEASLVENEMRFHVNDAKSALRQLAELRAFADDTYRRCLWDAAASVYEKLLAAGGSLEECGPKIVTCLLNVRETILGGDVRRIEDILQQLDRAGHAGLVVPLRQQLQAKLPSQPKKWWK